MDYVELIGRLTEAARMVAPLMDAGRAVAALVRNIHSDHIPTTDPDGNAITQDAMRLLIEADAKAATSAWHEDDGVGIDGRPAAPADGDPSAPADPGAGPGTDPV